MENMLTYLYQPINTAIVQNREHNVELMALK